MKWLERSSSEDGSKAGRVRRRVVMISVPDTFRQWKKCSNEKLSTLTVMGPSPRSRWSEEKWCLISCRTNTVLTKYFHHRIKYFQHQQISRSPLHTSTRLSLQNLWMLKDVSRQSTVPFTSIQTLLLYLLYVSSHHIKCCFFLFPKEYCQFHFSRGRKRFDYMFLMESSLPISLGR